MEYELSRVQTDTFRWIRQRLVRDKEGTDESTEEGALECVGLTEAITVLDAFLRRHRNRTPDTVTRVQRRVEDPPEPVRVYRLSDPEESVRRIYDE